MAGGVTRIEDLVNALPHAFATHNPAVSNGSTGTAGIASRGFEDPCARYSLCPLSYDQRPERRYTSGELAHYEFGEHPHR